MHPRITIDPAQRGGKPCIRRLGITVEDVLGWLAEGMSESEILARHPELESGDFRAIYQFTGSGISREYANG